MQLLFTRGGFMSTKEEKITAVIVTTLLFVCFTCGCLNSGPQVQQVSPFKDTVLDPDTNRGLDAQYQPYTLFPFIDAGKDKHFISSDSMKVSLESPYDTISRHYVATSTNTKVISLVGGGAYSIIVTTDAPQDAVKVSWVRWYTTKVTDKFGNVEYGTSSSDPNSIGHDQCVSNKHFDCKTMIYFGIDPLSNEVQDRVDVWVIGRGSGTIEITRIPVRDK
jgi:hypothetical protein